MVKLNGEAVVVDIAPMAEDPVCAAKTGADGDMASYPARISSGLEFRCCGKLPERIAKRQGITTPAEVAPEHYPIMVTFRDINDPTSIEMIDPANLEASFGKGVSLSAVILEVTDHQMTAGIGKSFRNSFGKHGRKLINRQISRHGGVVRNPDNL